MAQAQPRAAEFWTTENDYHDLARRVEQNIEITHPDKIKGECRHVCGLCGWPASTVTYYEYRGESI